MDERNAGMAKETGHSAPCPDPLSSPADRLCEWVRRKKLETPAALFLEVHRPLMPLAWPAAVLVGPFIAPLFGPDYYEKIEALRDPAALDRVLARLSARAVSDAVRAAGEGAVR
jgi:hypothetical protein